MNWWLIFAVFLYLASAVLIVAEVFIPSGGLISLCSMACLIGGLAIFFNFSTTVGIIGIAVALVLVPTVIITAYKIFPYTSFGKAVTLTPSIRIPGEAIPDNEKLATLVGKQGIVITPLRPVGTCEIEGEKYMCVAEGGYVDKNKKAKVIRAQGMQLIVRVIEED